MNIQDVLKQAIDMQASDVYLVSGAPISIRLNGNLVQLNSDKLFPDDIKNLVEEIYDLAGKRDMVPFCEKGDMVLDAVISQQLIPSVDGGVVPAFEIMTVTPAIRNMIRDNKIHQIEGLLYSSNLKNMISMDQSILNLYKEGIISKENALVFATNSKPLSKKL